MAIHTWNEGTVTTSATEAQPGEMLFTCTACAQTKTESIPKLEPVTPGAHQHTFSSEWKKNADGHWHECSCGEKSDLAFHVWDSGKETKPATTSAGGEKLFTCTDCNVTKTEAMEKLKDNAPIPGKLTVESFVSLVKIYKIEIAIIAFAGIMVLLFIEAIIFFICKLVKRKKANASIPEGSSGEIELIGKIDEMNEPQKHDWIESDLAEELEEVSENNPSSNT